MIALKVNGWSCRYMPQASNQCFFYVVHGPGPGGLGIGPRAWIDNKQEITNCLAHSSVSPYIYNTTTWT